MKIKKTFILLFFAFMPLGVYSQNIKLELNDSCEFVTSDDKSYFIVEYPGKTAHEIYEGLYTNIVKIYNDAKNVTNSVPDKVISVRAFADPLIDFCWWKEPKKLTLGKAALAYVTVGVSLAVDAFKSGSFYNGDFSVAGYYKLNIEIKDGKAKIDMPIMDGIFSVIDLNGNKKNLEISDFGFKIAVRINRDKAIYARKKKREKAEEANIKKERYLK